MNPTPPPRARVPRLPYILLGLMTAATLVGPLVIGYVLRGGDSPDWPPDRPMEWLILVAVCVTVVTLMLACLSLALINRNPPATRPPDAKGGP